MNATKSSYVKHVTRTGIASLLWTQNCRDKKRLSITKGYRNDEEANVSTSKRYPQRHGVCGEKVPIAPNSYALLQSGIFPLHATLYADSASNAKNSVRLYTCTYSNTIDKFVFGLL